MISHFALQLVCTLSCLIDFTEKLQTETRSLSSSETRCSELESERKEEVRARSRVESELKLLSQQQSRHGPGDDSPHGTSASKAEATRQELQDIR